MNKQTFRLWLWRKFGVAVWRGGLPFGADAYLDIDRLGFRPAVIFDVGANVGEKSLYMSNLWPDADIHAFEPVATTFQTLRSNVGTAPRIRPWNVALSDSVGQAEIFLDEQYSELSSMNATRSGRSELINRTTLDAFASDRQIDRVDLLKIDTEGHEEAVLHGARGLFERIPPSICVVEGGFNEAAPFVPATTLFKWFDHHGYRFAGSYEHGVNFKGFFLERADLLFIHRRH
jgi:FkbM family methyltransferase